jgi:hypothetical protein
VVPEAAMPLTLVLHGNIVQGATTDIYLLELASDIREFRLVAGDVAGHCIWYMPVSNGSRYCKCARHESAVSRVTCLESGFQPSQ